MNPRNPEPASAGFTRRNGLLALVGGVAALAGCGGGGGGIGSGIASVTSGGTGSYSSGAITGFGSIIVNGVRFDDSQATVTDDDGTVRSTGDLQLGMVVAVTGSAISTTAAGSTATASSISWSSELKGPIDSKGNQTLVVLGQTVQMTGSTVFEAGISGGLAGLSAGQIVEVHGYVDPARNAIVATRIERESSATAYKLQGVVSALNTTAKTFAVGALVIGYGSASEVPSGLANGMLVRVRLATLPATGTRTATLVRKVEPKPEDRDEAEVEGSITAFTSNSSFSVNGLPVDATKASFPAGTAALKVGTRVEVKGRLSGGILVATEVKVETESEVNALEYELHGTISSLNTTAKTFVVRGVTVNYGGPVTFDKGDATKLVDGVTVEVKGTYTASTNTVLATRIAVES